LSRPFDESHYKGLLKGLEISEIPLSQALVSDRSGRFDSGYFTKAQIALREKAKAWTALGAYASRVVCGPFGSTILDTNYQESGVPMIRPFNLRELRSDVGVIVYLSPAFVSGQNLKMFRRGDLAFARVGDVGCAIIVQPEATISPNVIVASISGTVLNPSYATVFFNTKYGLLQMEGAIKAVAQPTISTEIIRELRIPLFSETFQTRIQQILEGSEAALGKAKAAQGQAEKTLLRALGLENWEPYEPLTYIRRASEAFAAGRLDSDYFSPRVSELLQKLGEAGLTVGAVASARHERFSPSKNGNFDYIEIGNVRADGTVDAERLPQNHAPSRATSFVRAGDVITSSVRPIRRLSAIITPEQDGFVCSSGLVVLQPRDVPSEVLLTYLRLPPLCKLMDLHTSASLYPAISEADLLALPFHPITNEAEADIVNAVRSAHAARRQARALQNAAKRTVEIGIEKSETEALAYLKKYGE
jgi:hypothetical protein